MQAFKVTVHCITSTHIITEYNLPEAFCCSSWIAANSISANGAFIVFSLVAVEPERYSVDTKIKKIPHYTIYDVPAYYKQKTIVYNSK